MLLWCLRRCNNLNLVANRTLFNKISWSARDVTTRSSVLLDEKDIPSPKGLPFIGTTLSLLAAGSTPKLHEYVDRRHKELGPIFREKIGPADCVFVSDPEMMRSVFAQEGKYPIHILPEAWMVYNKKYSCSRGLLFMNGEEWLRFRKIMNKFLLKGNLNWIENSCDVASDRIIHKIEATSQRNSELENLEEELYKWSLDVLVSILVGSNAYKLINKDVESYIKELASTIHLVFQTSAKLALIPSEFASKYNIYRWRNFKNSVDTALYLANNLVDKLFKDYPNNDGLLQKMVQENMLRNDINKIVIDLVLAAGDTTAYSMEWILYLMSKNEKVQEQLRNSNFSPQFLRNIVRESLRLYPVASFLTRILPEDSNIGGYKIKANNLIIMSIYTSGRDPKYFKDPQKFLPDRWSRTPSTGGVTTNQQASLPFAMGSRSCVGKKIAEIQLQMTLAKIVKNFNIELCNKKDVDVILKLVAVPSSPIRLKFHKL